MENRQKSKQRCLVWLQNLFWHTEFSPRIWFYLFKREVLKAVPSLPKILGFLHRNKILKKDLKHFKKVFTISLYSASLLLLRSCLLFRDNKPSGFHRVPTALCSTPWPRLELPPLVSSIGVHSFTCCLLQTYWIMFSDEHTLLPLTIINSFFLKPLF